MGLQPRLQRRAKRQSGRPGPSRPGRLPSCRGTPLPEPAPRRGPRRGRAAPAPGSLREPRLFLPVVDPATRLPVPRSGSGPRSGPRRPDRASRVPTAASPARGPAAPRPLPDTHPPPGTCWPPWPFPPPPPAAQRAREARGRGLGPRRRPGAELAPRGSLGRARAAGTAAASAVAAHLRPQRSAAAATTAHAGRRGPRRRSASSGTSSAAAAQSRLGPLSSRSRSRRWARGLGFRLLPERLRRTGEQGGRSARVGERDPGARPLPEAARLPPARRGPRSVISVGGPAPPLGRSGSGLTPLLAPPTAPPTARALRGVICERLCLSFARVARARLAPRPHPLLARRHPAEPHKRTGRRLCFWFIAPRQAAGIGAPAGAARLSLRVYTVCAGVLATPSRGMRDWECLQVEKEVGA